jgi:hypothetical protein
MLHHPTLRGMLLGGILGVALCAALSVLVAMAPRTLRMPEARYGVIDGPERSGVTLSFVTTGTASVPGFMLAQGLGLRSQPIALRAAVLEHPQGLVVFGTGVTSERSEERLPWNVSNPFGRVDERRAVSEAIGERMAEVDRVILPTPRWYHVGDVPAFSGHSIWTTNGDKWAATNGPWPRRFGFNREDVASLPLTPVRWNQPGTAGLGNRRAVYSDNSIVMVRLRGSTSDEVGLLVTLDDGRRVLLVADAVWLESQVTELRPRFFGSTWNYDRNRFQLGTLQRTLGALQANHGIDVVPMLDGTLALPEWPERW